MGTVLRPADADLYHAGPVDDTRLDRAAERGAVVVPLAPLVVVGVGVRVNVDHPERLPDRLAHRLQQRDETLQQKHQRQY